MKDIIYKIFLFVVLLGILYFIISIITKLIDIIRLVGGMLWMVML